MSKHMNDHTIASCNITHVSGGVIHAANRFAQRLKDRRHKREINFDIEFNRLVVKSGWDV